MGSQPTGADPGREDAVDGDRTMAGLAVAALRGRRPEPLLRLAATTVLAQTAATGAWASIGGVGCAGSGPLQVGAGEQPADRGVRVSIPGRRRSWGHLSVEVGDADGRRARATAQSVAAVVGAALDRLDEEWAKGQRAGHEVAAAWARLADADAARRDALDINDNIVQGLAVAIADCERADREATLSALRATLDSARHMMRDRFGDSAVAAGDFVCHQPATPSPPEAHAPPAGAAQPNGDRKSGPQPVDPSPVRRVLVADDSADMRLALRLMLGQEPGFTVVAEAATGDEAVAAAADHRPDVVLLDLAMPGLDGLSALPLVQAASPGCQVVMLSGFDDDRPRRAALAGGAAAYVAKGMPAGELLALLADLTGLAGPTERPDHPSPAASAGPRTAHPLPAAVAARHRSGLATAEATLDFVLHELKTPLSVARGLLGTLRDQGGQLRGATQHMVMEAVSRNVDLMADLIQAATATHEVDSGELTVNRAATDLVALVDEVLADLGDVLAGHTVSVAGPERLEMAADSLRLRQVLSNLLVNAAKYSGPGSSIEIDLRPGATATEIAVTDHGPGIPGEMTERLFGRFARLDHPSAGLGLGLYLSRAIVEAHGGSLELTSTGPGGTTFTVTVPRLDVDALVDIGG